MNQQTGPQQGSADSTGEHPGPRVSRTEMRDVNRLRRSRTDRYVAGVAGGLGRHFDIDPTIIRVLLAVLTFFGGAGVLIYGVVWLFVPEDGDDRAPVDLNPDVLKIVLIVTGAIALMAVFGTPFFDNSWGFGFPFPLLVIGLVVVAIVATRDRRRRPGPTPPPPWGSTPPAAPSATPSATQEGTTMSTTETPDTTAGTTDPTRAYEQPYGYQGYDQGYGQGQPPAWMPPPAPAYVPPPRPRRTGVVLFWPTLALLAIGLGTLGIFDVNDGVTVSAYGALAVAITGIMLVVGAFVARPGGLIALGLAATTGLAITGGIDAATDGETGGESITVRPTSAAMVQDEYSVPNGELTVDLSGVSDVAALAGREIYVHLNAGDIEVILPRGINAEVEADMHFAGEVVVDGVSREGFNPTLDHTITGSSDPGAPTIQLEVDARVGQITVERD